MSPSVGERQTPRTRPEAERRILFSSYGVDLQRCEHTQPYNNSQHPSRVLRRSRPTILPSIRRGRRGALVSSPGPSVSVSVVSVMFGATRLCCLKTTARTGSLVARLAREENMSSGILGFSQGPDLGSLRHRRTGLFRTAICCALRRVR